MRDYRPVALEDVVRLAKQRINVVEHVRNANTTLRTFLETVGRPTRSTVLKIKVTWSRLTLLSLFGQATESASGFDSASEATLRNAIQNHINALFDPADVGEDGDTAKPQQQAQLAISCNARRRKSNIDGQAQGCVASQALRVEFQSAISWIRDSKLVSASTACGALNCFTCLHDVLVRSYQIALTLPPHTDIGCFNRSRRGIATAIFAASGP